MEASINIIKSILSNNMATSGFPMIYKGEFTHEVIKMFSVKAENHILSIKKDPIYVMKVFHVMIECLQNISKHSDDYEKRKNANGNGIFILDKESNCYYVVTGNKVLNEHASRLKERIDYLNSLTIDELNELHKNQLIKTQISKKGGAGLGLIDIARKVKNKLVYKFFHMDSESQYFVLRVDVTE